jgi:Co/Zn/Cd efflux system component
MENKPNQSKNIMLTYGLYLGVASILISVVYYVLGMAYENDWKKSVISIAVSGLILFLGIKKFKESNEGFLTVGQAIKTGLGISLVAGIISVIYTIIFMMFIEPEFVNNLVEVTRQKTYEDNPELTEEQVDGAMEIVKKMSSPGMMSAFILLASLFFGFVISLISGLILKKEQNTY